MKLHRCFPIFSYEAVAFKGSQHHVPFGRVLINHVSKEVFVVVDEHQVVDVFHNGGVI